MEVVETYLFRITRNADVEIQEEEAADLLRTIEQGVRRRRFGAVVRLTVQHDMPQRIRDLLLANLKIGIDHIYEVSGPLGLSDLMALTRLDRPDLKDPPFYPSPPAVLRNAHTSAELFAAIRHQDILLHHPYDSFQPLVELIEAAAEDPNVLAIKQTLYRVGSNSPIVKALMHARDQDKQVTVLVELKARFDEENNITWARALERAGVHVVYGLVGLKTHAKIALVVRRELDGLRRYVHLGTGNYNATTARIYTDMGLLTCRPEIGADASDLFNFLTGYSRQRRYRTLLVAPVNLRDRLNWLIEREIAHAASGRPGHLIFKLNAVVDPSIIDLLYRASQAGVKIDLIARGICCLRPGVPDLSENIQVRSIVGRFLEHSRVYYFGNGGEPEVFLGSADLMQRNLDRRVETLFPIEDCGLVAHIRDNLLDVYLRDNARARVLLPNGSYVRLHPEEGEQPRDSQSVFAAGHDIPPE
jgi:polyphosphate kinase